MVVTGHLPGHNRLRRHLYVMALSNNRTVESVVLMGKPQSTFCECEALGSLFLDPQGIRKLSIGAIWNFGRGTGLL
jgi:hypothetical protein